MWKHRPLFVGWLRDNRVLLRHDELWWTEKLVGDVTVCDGGEAWCGVVYPVDALDGERRGVDACAQVDDRKALRLPGESRDVGGV